MLKFRVCVSLGALGCVFLQCAAHAQTPADAGTLQQQLERERQTTLPARAAPQPPAASTGQTAPTASTMPVRAFQFSGNQLLSSAVLDGALASYLNRDLDLPQLQSAAAAVANAYRQAGWLADAYLPAQDIQDGVVRIQVVEAAFAGLTIEGQSPRIDAQRLQRGVAQQQALVDQRLHDMPPALRHALALGAHYNSVAPLEEAEQAEDEE